MDLDRQKWNAALKYVIDSMHVPNETMEKVAHEQEFFYEYCWIKDQLIEHAHNLWRNP